MIGKIASNVLCTMVLAGLVGCAASVNPNFRTSTPESAGTVAAFLTTSTANGAPAFSILVSGISLTDSNGKQVSLMSAPAQRELRHVELAPAMLSQTAGVPAGNFSSIGLTLANPELTLVDSQGNVTQLNGTTTPSVTLATSSVTIPDAISVATNGYVGVTLDFDLQSSISVNSSGNYIVTPVITAAPASPTEPSLVDDVGTITTISSTSPPAVNLQLLSGSSVTVNADGGTIFSSDITDVTNLRAGQTVELNADLQSSGSYLAKFLGSSTAELSNSYQGLVTNVAQNGSGNFSFTVAVQR
jgi:hypothetical protein